jgi:hypothetical protein
MPFKNVLKTEGVCVVEQLMLDNFLRTETPKQPQGRISGSVISHTTRFWGMGGVGLCIYRALLLTEFLPRENLGALVYAYIEL